MNISTSKRLFILCVFLSLFVINLSCKKVEKGESLITEEGKVINTGSVAADGCGWLIYTASGNEYSPQNLSSEYQVDSLKVRISYVKLSQHFFCGMLANNPGIPEIRLISIIRE